MLSRERLHGMILCLSVEKMKGTWSNLTTWSTLSLSPVPWDSSFFSPPHCSVSLGSRASSHFAPQLKNSLPPDLRNTDFFALFKTHPFRPTLPSAVLSKFLLIWLFFCLFFLNQVLLCIFAVLVCLYGTLYCKSMYTKGLQRMMFTIADSSSAVVQNQQIRHRCASPGF